ncbi:MAG: hypothetical protein ACI85K_002053, partial [Hyphomicrobiaceae bacterium]
MRLPNCSLFVFGCLLTTMAAHAQSAPLTPVFS